MNPFSKKEVERTYEISPEHILEVRDLNVHIAVDDYDLHAVRGVNFALKKGKHSVSSENQDAGKVSPARRSSGSIRIIAGLKVRSYTGRSPVRS